MEYKKNTTGSLKFDGMDNADRPHPHLGQHDYNQSRLSPKTTGERANMVGNMVALGKPSLQGDKAANDRGPIVGMARPMNERRGGGRDRHVDTMVRGKAGPRRGNPSTAGGV